MKNRKKINGSNEIPLSRDRQQSPPIGASPTKN